VIPIKRQEGITNNAKEVQPKAFDVVERFESGYGLVLRNIDELVKIVKKAANMDGT